jgi:hypothetical protein
LRKKLKDIEAVRQYLPREDAASKSDGEDMSDSDESAGGTTTFKRCTKSVLLKAHKVLDEQDFFCAKLQAKDLTLAKADKLLKRAAEVLEYPAIDDIGGYDCSYLHSETFIYVSNLSRGFEKAVKKLQLNQSLQASDKPFVKMLRKKASLKTWGLRNSHRAVAHRHSVFILSA